MQSLPKDTHMESMFRFVNSIFRLSNRFVYLKISRDRLDFDFDDFNVYHFIQPRKWKHFTSCHARTVQVHSTEIRLIERLNYISDSIQKLTM